MNPVQWVWMMVAFLLALFALGWLAGLRLAAGSQLTLRGLALFNALVAIGVALVAARGEINDTLTHVGSNLIVVIAFVVLWRTGELLLDMSTSDLEQLAFSLIACGAIAWFGLAAPSSQARVATLFLAVSYAACRSSWLAHSSLRLAGQVSASRAILGIGWLVGMALMLRTASGLIGGESLAVDHSTPASQSLAFMFAGASFAINILFAYVVVGRVVRRLHRLSRHDMLTGLLNRRAIVDAAEQEWDRLMRTGQTFSVAFLDVDHFKSINDGFGHAAGDHVLTQVAAALRENLRRGDLVGRSGGEEFLVLLVGADRLAALDAAERLRRAMVQRPGLRPDPDHPVTVSLGVATSGEGVGSLDDLVARADAALYRAKALGRNRVSADPPDEPGFAATQR
jgi:diguanylate cyclase (GGDEF)-like protein